jgi:hypothetical protein
MTDPQEFQIRQLEAFEPMYERRTQAGQIEMPQGALRADRTREEDAHELLVSLFLPTTFALPARLGRDGQVRERVHRQDRLGLGTSLRRGSGRVKVGRS